jgi:hypothetical protein
MVGFAGDVDGIDVVIRLDLALAVHLARVRVDEAEAIQDHLSIPPKARADSTPRGELVSNSRAALAKACERG